MKDEEPSLRKQYPNEYMSWSNMRRRRKTHEAVIHPDFETFEGFVHCMGPKPSDQHTLDRINSTDPEYAPGKVRWASKDEQANNRRNTSFLTYEGSKYPDHSGKTRPLTEWAKITGQKAVTLRRRKSDGWTDTEIIDGSRPRTAKTFEEMTKGELLNYQPWPEKTKQQDEEKFVRHRQEGETRFAFERRLITAELRRPIEEELSAIADDFSGEPEAFDNVPEDRLYRGWILRSDADLHRFSELKKEHLDTLRMLDESQREESRWRRVIGRRVNQPKRQAQIARELEREIRDELEDEDIYDEEGYRLDD